MRLSLILGTRLLFVLVWSELLENSSCFQTVPKTSHNLCSLQNWPATFSSRAFTRLADTPQGSEISPKESNLFEKIDLAGQSLKPKAVKASANASLEEKKSRKVLYVLKSSLYYALFILYRAYRGFFVLLPAVFREVYRKLERAVDSPFDSADLRNDEINQDIRQGRWKTRMTVSVLATFVTFTYVISGAFRVLVSFVRNLTKTTDVSGSFAAAAEEQERNEDKILRYTQRRGINGTSTDLKP